MNVNERPLRALETEWDMPPPSGRPGSRITPKPKHAKKGNSRGAVLWAHTGLWEGFAQHRSEAHVALPQTQASDVVDLLGETAATRKPSASYCCSGPIHSRHPAGPKVVGHHPIRPMLGRIDADDGEPLPTHLLDSASNEAIWFLQVLCLAGHRAQLADCRFLHRSCTPPLAAQWRLDAVFRSFGGAQLLTQDG
jgi:hypothetical protein